MFQVYEISIESTLQIILQTGVLLFQLFSIEPLSYDFLDEKGYTTDIISITTSFVSIMWGLSSYKINVSMKEPKIFDKVILMVRSSVEIIARLEC